MYRRVEIPRAASLPRKSPVVHSKSTRWAWHQSRLFSHICSGWLLLASWLNMTFRYDKSALPAIARALHIGWREEKCRKSDIECLTTYMHVMLAMSQGFLSSQHIPDQPLTSHQICTLLASWIIDPRFPVANVSSMHSSGIREVIQNLGTDSSTCSWHETAAILDVEAELGHLRVKSDFDRLLVTSCFPNFQHFMWDKILGDPTAPNSS